MQHKTGLAGISAGGRIRQTAKDNIGRILPAGYFLTGIIMANTSLFGDISPFGAAVCAAAPGGAGIFTAFGAIAGYAVLGPATQMKYIAAVMLAAAAKWLFSSGQGVLGGIFGAKREAASAVAAVFLSLMTAGIANLLNGGATLYDLLLCLSEVFFACGAAYFFSKAAACVRSGIGGAQKSELSCVVISAAMILMGLSGIGVMGVSVGRVLSALCVLLAARLAGEAGGAVAGVTAGIAMGLSGGDITYVVAAYGFGGLIAGIFAGAGRLAAAASFVLTNAVVAFLTQAAGGVYISVFEVFASSVLFIAMPGSLVNRVRPIATGAVSDGAYTRQALRDRLSDVSSALLNIGDTTKKVSEGLSKLEDPPQADLTAKVAEKLCRRCTMKNTCWQFSKEETARAANDAVNVLKRRGNVTAASAPRYFVQNCVKLDELLAAFNTQFQNNAAKRGTQLKMSRVRAVIADQFSSLAGLLDELADEVCCVRAFDEGRAGKVRDYFERENLAAGRVQAYRDAEGRLFVSFVIPARQVARLRRVKSALDLCEILEADLDPPQITLREPYASVVFPEKTTFFVECEAYQAAGGGARLCGDTYELIRNKSGLAHFILSDGMGSGGGAAVDSAMAAGLISQLLAIGVSHDAALKTVNSALIVKSGEESLATLDITTVDLYTGRADFYKAGAAPTFVLKNKRAGYIESSSLPAGILRNVAFERSVMSLREGDIIVMVSDGVTAAGVDWIMPALEGLGGKGLGKICETLAESARVKRCDNREDDITVVAAEIKRAGT